MNQREQKGIETYGKTLKTWNGRDTNKDLLEELIDAFQYAVQTEMEKTDLMVWLWEAINIGFEILNDQSDKIILKAQLIILKNKVEEALQIKRDEQGLFECACPSKFVSFIDAKECFYCEKREGN